MVNRFQYPSSFGFPLKYFMLDRCFLENRYKLQNGKDLIIVNLHNSAFDSDGSLRAAEIKYLRQYVDKEYAEGNYLICILR